LIRIPCDRHGLRKPLTAQARTAPQKLYAAFRFALARKATHENAHLYPTRFRTASEPGLARDCESPYNIVARNLKFPAGGDGDSCVLNKYIQGTTRTEVEGTSLSDWITARADSLDLLPAKLLHGTRNPNDLPKPTPSGLLPALRPVRSCPALTR
jgi:hypothetical protein